jgi:hypothetical protein
VELADKTHVLGKNEARVRIAVGARVNNHMHLEAHACTVKGPAGLAQLAEQFIRNEQVRGSSPRFGSHRRPLRPRIP